MSTEEKEIHDFLKLYPHLFITVAEISRQAGNHRRYAEDRGWARPILRRMEHEGLVESNSVGEYRVRLQATSDTAFLDALNKPGINLGDTTIIKLGS